MFGASVIGEEKQVAVKVIVNEGEQKWKFKQQKFIEEYNLLIECQSNFVIQTFEFVLEENFSLFTMESCLISLWKVGRYGIFLRNRQRYILFLLAPIIEAVGFLHRNNIVHNDIKVHNVLLTEKGVPKLADFGLAVKMKRSKKQKAPGISLYYTLPERLKSFKVDKAYDIWCLGLMVYEIVNGDFSLGMIFEYKQVLAHFPNISQAQFDRLMHLDSNGLFFAPRRPLPYINQEWGALDS